MTVDVDIGYVGRSKNIILLNRECRQRFINFSSVIR